MWLYYCLIVWAFLCLYGKNKNYHKKRNGIVLAVIPLWFLCAFRGPDIGNDTSTYIQLFEISRNNTLQTLFSSLGSRFESGFLIYMHLIGRVFSNPQWLLIISSTIAFSILGWFIYKYSQDPFFSIFLFITMRYYAFFMSNVRQSIAICIILISYDLIQKKKYILAGLTILLAMSFHTSAIVFIIAIPLAVFKFKRRHLIYLIGGLGAVLIGWDRFFGAVLKYTPLYYEMYSNSSYMTNANNLANLMNLLVVVLLSLVMYSSLKSDNEFMVKHNDYIYYALASTFFSVLSLKFGMFGRIQYYFSIFLIVMFANSLVINKHAKNGVVIKSAAIVMFLIYFTIIMIFRPEWQHIYPYNFCF